MSQLLANSIAQPRFHSRLVSFFAAVAMLLAAVGIYGVIACSVGQRAREIGIRMALGAQRHDVLRMVLRQGMSLAGAGIAFGLTGAFALTRLLRTLLFGVGPTDPLTFVVVPVLLAVVAWMACWLPARRASKADPMEALRYE